MRIVAIALATFAVAGCGDDTVLRIVVEPGVASAPASLLVTLDGVSATPRTIAPVTLPGTIVIHRVPSSVSELCVEVAALDAAANIIAGGAARAHLVAHGTAQATVTLDSPPTTCDQLPPDDLGNTIVDLAGNPPPDDLAAPPGSDLAYVACPANAIFCDDFESGTFGKWTMTGVKLDAGSVGVQSTTKAHGTYAMRSLGNGMAGTQVYAEAEKDFPPTAPPFALRANVFYPATLDHFNQLIALYENSTGSINSFAIGGDNNNAIWEVSENESNGPPDRFSDMVPTGAGQWHCVELTIDAGGMVDFYVDNHHLIGPFARANNVSYSMLLVGITRSVTTDFVAYIDDVAIGPSRLYCPP